MALRLRHRFTLWSLLVPAFSVMFAISLAYQSEKWLRVLGRHVSAILVRPLFTIGSIAVSPSFIFKSLIFLAALTLVSRWLENVLRTRILAHTGSMRNNNTRSHGCVR
jgi:small-conductance mechanosensitive channel